MELIYADSELNDIGVLKSYDIDFAFGSNENNFELTVDIENDILGIGAFIYYDHSGYGGVVDSKSVSTINKTVKYSGRTLEGILNSFIVKPDNGSAYFLCDGNANSILNSIISRCNLGAIFKASNATAKTISNYTIRYKSAYDAIVEMLKSNGMKLKITTAVNTDNKTIFELSAVDIVDYSIDEEWNSDQVKVESDVYYNQPNHLICLGSGNLASRHVIHLFCDSDGVVQRYANVDTPVKDSDYILNESQKVFSGIDEVTEVYDYPNAGMLDNYILLSEMPANWSDYTTQGLYAYKDGDSYTALQPLAVTKYEITSSEPYAWSTEYSNYFQSIDGVYQSVPSVDVEVYSKLTSEPADWSTNWGNYYTYKTDGVNEVYEQVQGFQTGALDLQTMQPSDWEYNYNNYLTAGGYKVQAVTKTVEYNLPQSNVSNTALSYEYFTTAEQFTSTSRGSGTQGGNALKRENYFVAVNELTPIATASKYYAHTVYGNLGISQEALNAMASIDAALMTYEGYYVQFKLAEAKLDAATTDAEIMAAMGEVNHYIYEMTQRKDYVVNSFNALKNDFAVLGLTLIIAQYGETFTETSARTTKCGFIVTDLCRNLYYGVQTTGAPVWQPNTYYTARYYYTAPSFGTTDYYSLSIQHNPPTWVIGKYYKAVSAFQSNAWESGKYYRHWEDHYYNLALAGIEKLKSLRKTNNIKAKLNAQQEYDIGDLIGVYETITNGRATMAVTKKIIKGTNNNLTISYTLG